MSMDVTVLWRWLKLVCCQQGLFLCNWQALLAKNCSVCEICTSQVHVASDSSLFPSAGVGVGDVGVSWQRLQTIWALGEGGRIDHQPPQINDKKCHFDHFFCAMHFTSNIFSNPHHNPMAKKLCFFKWGH